MKKVVLFLVNENTVAVLLTVTVFFMIYVLRAQGIKEAAAKETEVKQELLIKNNNSITFVDVAE